MVSVFRAESLISFSVLKDNFFICDMKIPSDFYELKFQEYLEY